MADPAIKLHLGCGAVYLDGYVNIDVADSGGERSPDVISPIEALAFPSNTIAEIRIEHVFEHLPRWMGELVLLEWHNWLLPNGILRIAVPDFEAAAQAILNSPDEEESCFKFRHIFGNHISAFSFHLDGFTPRKLRWLLERHGYSIAAMDSVQIASGTPKERRDIHVHARKRTGLSQDARVSGMLRAMELYHEPETIPFIEEYLRKIAGESEIRSNFWLSRYDGLHP